MSLLIVTPDKEGIRWHMFAGLGTVLSLMFGHVSYWHLDQTFLSSLQVCFQQNKYTDSLVDLKDIRMILTESHMSNIYLDTACEWQSRT